MAERERQIAGLTEDLRAARVPAGTAAGGMRPVAADGVTPLPPAKAPVLHAAATLLPAPSSIAGEPDVPPPWQDPRVLGGAGAAVLTVGLLAWLRRRRRDARLADETGFA